MYEGIYFSEALANERELHEHHRIALDRVYGEMFAVLARPTMHSEDPKDIPAIITGFEYVLQSLWGFPLDSKFHRYQLEIEGCTCPFLDNMDRIGHTRQRVINGNCPFHGLSNEG